MSAPKADGAAMSAQTRVLWRARTLLRGAWARLGAAVLLGAAATGCAVALMATSAWLIARAAAQPPVLTLMVAIVAVRTFGIGRGVLRYAERLMSHDAAFAALGEVRVRAYRRLERLAPAGLPGWARGDLLGRVVGDVDDVADLALRGLLPLGSAALVLLATIGLATALLPAAGLVLLVAVAVSAIGAPLLWTRASRHAEAQLVRLRRARDADVVELLESAADLAAYGAAAQWIERTDALEVRIAAVRRRSARLAGAAFALGILAMSAAVWASVLVGVPAVAGGSLSGPVFAVLVLTPLALVEVVQSVPLAAQELQRVRASAARVLDLLDAPDPVPPLEDPAPLPAQAAAAPAFALRDLSARWPGQRGLALDGVSLDIPAAARIAIVGASGSGKSTLLAALLRFVQPCAGSLTVGGADVATLDDDAVRSLSALCDQDAYLFDSTIAENVRLARPDADDDEVLDALRRAKLGDWVAGLPLGIGTRVGEHGVLVSGGQRQRIALARALLADRPVLLLDEPTAGLDDATARALLGDLLAEPGRTVVLVTHRPDGLDAMDQVIELDAGRIVRRVGAAAPAG